MRKYREFTADYITETDAITGRHNYESVPTTIDIFSVVSFNPGADYHHTTVRTSEGTMFDLKITYQKFKQIMQAEVPDFAFNSN
jgi:hypothetical protein